MLYASGPIAQAPRAQGTSPFSLWPNACSWSPGYGALTPRTRTTGVGSRVLLVCGRTLMLFVAVGMSLPTLMALCTLGFLPYYLRLVAFGGQTAFSVCVRLWRSHSQGFRNVFVAFVCLAVGASLGEDIFQAHHIFCNRFQEPRFPRYQGCFWLDYPASTLCGHLGRITR